MGTLARNELKFINPYIYTEAVVRRCSVKVTCARVSFLIKLQASACNFIKKEALTQVFSCEFCEISKNTSSYRTPPLAASICINSQMLLIMKFLT